MKRSIELPAHFVSRTTGGAGLCTGLKDQNWRQVDQS
jgi:hypothetical protein